MSNIVLSGGGSFINSQESIDAIYIQMAENLSIPTDEASKKKLMESFVSITSTSTVLEVLRRLKDGNDRLILAIALFQTASCSFQRIEWLKNLVDSFDFYEVAVLIKISKWTMDDYLLLYHFASDHLLNKASTQSEKVKFMQLLVPILGFETSFLCIKVLPWNPEERSLLVNVLVGNFSTKAILHLPNLPISDEERKTILDQLALTAPFLVLALIDSFGLDEAGILELTALCRYKLDRNPENYPLIDAEADLQSLQDCYFRLQEEKWKESIDGNDHSFGPYVYDQGLHGRTVEPGYLLSMQRAFAFVGRFLNRKIDADWYLVLHRHTASHFTGENGVLVDQSSVGVFRGEYDLICCHVPPDRLSPTARKEVAELDREIRGRFGEGYGLAHFIDRPETGMVEMVYHTMSKDQVKDIFNWFLNSFYEEIELAVDKEARLRAIARLHQRLEWLHPVVDATLRTTVALLNKNLVDYGFHPVILNWPCAGDFFGLEEWIKYLEDSLRLWELTASGDTRAT